MVLDGDRNTDPERQILTVGGEVCYTWSPWHVGQHEKRRRQTTIKDLIIDRGCDRSSPKEEGESNAVHIGSPLPRASH